MIQQKYYPRVLLVHMTKVHQADAVNLLVRTLFGDWPKGNLAQIYTGCCAGNGDFCGHYYEIGPRDRSIGRLFYALKSRAVSAVSGHPTALQDGSRQRVTSRQIWATRVVSQFIASGIWDLAFHLKLNDSLRQFISSFSPQIIYTQGYSLSLTSLSLVIADQFSVPIWYLPVDDWHSCLYAGSPVHRRVVRIATTIAQRASLRFALGPKMAETLTTRYGVPFHCLYHADDMTRFVRARSPRSSANRSLVIGYTGSLYLGRMTALVDLLNACYLLHGPFTIKVYCPDIPTNMSRELLDSAHVDLLPLPAHDELPGVLADCDILFLPESFDPAHKKAIELSLSTKAHLYMMSGRPILVYAPPWSGIVDYAQRSGWGIIVDKRHTQDLLAGIRQASGPTSMEWVTRAFDVARTNHDIATLRTQVHQLIGDEVGRQA